MNEDVLDVSVSVDGYREARLDHVIAEELFANDAFVAWLWGFAGESTEATTSVQVTMNADERDPDLPPEAHGETDVRATVRLADGSTSAFLIENKVWAPFQPKQPERYRMRADHYGGRSLLICPERYGAYSPQSPAPFDGHVSIEAVASWLEEHGGRRGQWSASLLRDLVRRSVREAAPDDVPTVEFTAHCVRWFEVNAPYVVPAPRSLHTRNQGWLDFETPAPLIYKVVGVQKHDQAMVDLYVAELGLERGELIELVGEIPCSVALDDGTEQQFVVDIDTKGNLLLRFWVDKVVPAAGVPTGRAGESVESALRACAAAAHWLERVHARFDSGAS